MSRIGFGHRWETVIESRRSKSMTRVVCMNCGYRTYFTSDLTRPCGTRYIPPEDCQEYIVQSVMCK